MLPGFASRLLRQVDSLAFAFSSSQVDATNQTTYTFSGFSFGTAHATRIVFAGITYTGTSITIASVTIGGVTATNAVTLNGTANSVAIFYAAVPTGTSGDVVVTLSGAGCTHMSCGVWRGYPESSTPLDSATVDDTAGVVTVPNVEVKADGFLIAVGANAANDALTIGYNGVDPLVTDSASDYAGEAGYRAIGSVVMTTENDATRDVTFTAASSHKYACAASWQLTGDPASQIAFDAYSKLTGQTTADWSFTHTPVGTPRGILVLIAGTLGVDRVTSVTYGGVAMTEVALSPTLHTGTEPASVYGYFLGSGIPTGAQTVAVTGTAGDVKDGYCFSVTSGADTSVQDTSSVTSGSLANPSVTLSLGGVPCFCAIAFFTGQNDVSGYAPTANWTARDERDAGTACLGNYSYDIIGTADVAAGFTAGADDVALLAVAIR